MEFMEQFRAIFPRLLIYLVVPFYLGLQFSYLAKDERKADRESNVGSYVLDALGLLFAVGVPVLFIVSSLALFKFGESHPEAMAALFRFGMMFFFFGVWWQFFGIMAIKAFRDRGVEINRNKYALFYAAAAVFISLNAFLGGEWFLKWASLIFFAGVSPVLMLSCRRMYKTFLVMAAVAFVIQTVGFVYLSAII